MSPDMSTTAFIIKEFDFPQTTFIKSELFTSNRLFPTLKRTSVELKISKEFLLYVALFKGIRIRNPIYVHL